MVVDEQLRADVGAMTLRMAEERARDRDRIRALERESAEQRDELNRLHDLVEDLSRSLDDLEWRVRRSA